MLLILKFSESSVRSVSVDRAEIGVFWSIMELWRIPAPCSELSYQTPYAAMGLWAMGLWLYMIYYLHAALQDGHSYDSVLTTSATAPFKISLSNLSTSGVMTKLLST